MNDSIIAPTRATTEDKHRSDLGPLVAVEATTARAAYTNEQLKRALEEVASKTDTLRMLLAYAVQDPEAHDCQIMINAAIAMADTVGAIADVAIGGACIGGFEQWIYGSSFRDLADRGAA